MIPERDAAVRLASAVGEYLDPRWLTDACLVDVMGKVVARRDLVRQVFDELDADPGKLPLPVIQRKQQRDLTLDDQDAWLEELREAEDRAGFARYVLRAMSSPHVDRYDPDEVAADRQDRQDTQTAHDEAADAPMVAP